MDYDNFVAEVLKQLDYAFALTIRSGGEDDATLSLDSIERFELLVAVETLAEVKNPPRDAPAICTMADAYEYYESLRRM
jgi:acyl carrier protein